MPEVLLTMTKSFIGTYSPRVNGIQIWLEVRVLKEVCIAADEVIASINRRNRLENLNMVVGHRSILALYCANYDSLCVELNVIQT